MAAIRPIETLDPSGHWWREERILDTDQSTWVHHWHAAELEWTDYLVVVFPLTYSEMLRLVMLFPYVGESWQLDIHRDEQWVNLVSTHHGKGATSGPVSFLPGRVDAVRFRMKADGEGHLFGGPALIYLEEACSGPLRHICGLLHSIGTFFIDLASDIRELWLVGEFLAIPFEELGELFQDGADTCCEASATLQGILDALEEGITPGSLLALIQASWPTLYNLITDPVDWFLVQLTLAFDLEPWHTQSLEFLAKWILEEYFFTLYQIWLDPDAWIEDNVLPLIPSLPDWVTDPDTYLQDLLTRIFPALADFLADPAGWIENQVRAIIADLTEDLADFLDNAWDWLLDQYEDTFESIQARLYDLAEHTLRFFWEGEW